MARRGADVWLIDRVIVDVNHALAQLNLVALDADDALDQIRLGVGDRHEDDHLAALRSVEDVIDQSAAGLKLAQRAFQKIDDRSIGVDKAVDDNILALIEVGLHADALHFVVAG